MKDYPPPYKKKGSGSIPLYHDLGMLPLLQCFFAHLLILQYPDHHQNLISSSLYYSWPVHKISPKSVHNFLSNVVHRQTDRKTDRQTDRQTNQRYQIHNLLCQGGNNELCIKYFIDTTWCCKYRLSTTFPGELYTAFWFVERPTYVCGCTGWRSSLENVLSWWMLKKLDLQLQKQS